MCSVAQNTLPSEHKSPSFPFISFWSHNMLTSHPCNMVQELPQTTEGCLPRIAPMFQTSWVDREKSMMEIPIWGISDAQPAQPQRSPRVGSSLHYDCITILLPSLPSPDSFTSGSWFLEDTTVETVQVILSFFFQRKLIIQIHLSWWTGGIQKRHREARQCDLKGLPCFCCYVMIKLWSSHSRVIHQFHWWSSVCR